MSNQSESNITFIDRQKPAIKPGDYTIAVEQSIGAKTITQTPYTSGVKNFSISGERFSLKPEMVHAMFPPNGNTGEYSNMLPHIILNRSTLPYERTISTEEQHKLQPWLALLLMEDKETLRGEGKTENPACKQTWTIDEPFFIRRYGKNSAGKAAWDTLINEQLLEPIKESRKICLVTPGLAEGKYDSEAIGLDKKKIQKIINLTKNGQLLTLKEFLDSHKERAVNFPEIPLEKAQHERDYVKVIDIEKNLLAKILPPLEDLIWLVHVRQGKEVNPNENNGQQENQNPMKAVISGNRLPEKNKKYIACLVSLENRVKGRGFNFEKASGKDLIRMVTFHEWNFACVSANNSFEGLLKKVTAGTFRLPELQKEESPSEIQKEAEARRSEGFILMPHHTRSGGKTVSYYRGPLLPGPDGTTPESADLPLPAKVSDALLRYDKDTGIFEASYAGAYEIGRLLTLNNTRTAFKLLEWKRKIHQKTKTADEMEKLMYLPVIYEETTGMVPMPHKIRRWFDDLLVLRGVPFNYIVPNESMLPEESIRFFHIDLLWLAALLDGSLSVGRVTSRDRKQDQATREKEGFTADQLPVYSGFLLRSEAVAGWPDLGVHATDTLLGPEQNFPENQKLQMVRMERLSNNVLICIFEKQIKTLDLFLKPQGLQFGFKEEEKNKRNYYKTWKNPETGEAVSGNATPIQWRDEKMGTVNISQFINKIPVSFRPGPGESSAFALQMIEGMPRIRFRCE